MSALIFQKVTVESKADGEKASAEVIECGNCGSRVWVIFLCSHGEEPPHQHLQCADCDTTYCGNNRKA